MRRFVIAANWKMHKRVSEATDYASAFLPAYYGFDPNFCCCFDKVLVGEGHQKLDAFRL